MQQAAFEGAKQNILFNDNNDNMIQQLSRKSTSLRDRRWILRDN